MAALFRSQAGGSSLCPHTTALCLRRIFRHVRLFPSRHVHDELGKLVGVARALGLSVMASKKCLHAPGANPASRWMEFSHFKLTHYRQRPGQSGEGMVTVV